jgi:hypothetical protein
MLLHGLVVIGDFDVVGVLSAPAESDPQLVVDADAMLSFAVSLGCPLFVGESRAHSGA